MILGLTWFKVYSLIKGCWALTLNYKTQMQNPIVLNEGILGFLGMSGLHLQPTSTNPEVSSCKPDEHSPQKPTTEIAIFGLGVYGLGFTVWDLGFEV